MPAANRKQMTIAALDELDKPVWVSCGAAEVGVGITVLSATVEL